MTGTARLNILTASAILFAACAACAGKACAQCGGNRPETIAAKEKCLIGLERRIPRSLALSPKGEFAAVTDSPFNPVLVFDARTGKEKLQMRSQLGSGGGLQFIDSGKQILTSLKIWDAGSGQELFGLDRTELVGKEIGVGAMIGYLPGEKGGYICLQKHLSLRTGKFAGTLEKVYVQIRNTKTGELARQFRPTKDPDQFDSHAVSRDGKILAYASENEKTITLWDLGSAEQLATLGGHETRIREIHFGPGNKWIAGVGANIGVGAGSSLKIWEIEAGKMVRTIPLGRVPYGVALSPDGKWVAADIPSRKLLVIRNAATGEEALALERPGMVTVLAFSADGHTLALAGNGFIQVLEITAK